MKMIPKTFLIPYLPIPEEDIDLLGIETGMFEGKQIISGKKVSLPLLGEQKKVNKNSSLVLEEIDEKNRWGNFKNYIRPLVLSIGSLSPTAFDFWIRRLESIFDANNILLLKKIYRTFKCDAIVICGKNKIPKYVLDISEILAKDNSDQDIADENKELLKQRVSQEESISDDENLSEEEAFEKNLEYLREYMKGFISEDLESVYVSNDVKKRFLSFNKKLKNLSEDELKFIIIGVAGANGIPGEKEVGTYVREGAVEYMIDSSHVKTMTRDVILVGEGEIVNQQFEKHPRSNQTDLGLKCLYSQALCGRILGIANITCSAVRNLSHREYVKLEERRIGLESTLKSLNLSEPQKETNILQNLNGILTKIYGTPISSVLDINSLNKQTWNLISKKEKISLFEFIGNVVLAFLSRKLESKFKMVGVNPINFNKDIYKLLFDIFEEGEDPLNIFETDIDVNKIPAIQEHIKKEYFSDTGRTKPIYEEFNLIFELIRAFDQIKNSDISNKELSENIKSQLKILNNDYGMIGYNVWPKLGFDTDLKDSQFSFDGEILEGEGAFVRLKEMGIIDKDETDFTVQVFMRTAKGRQFWKEYGFTIDVKFSLKNEDGGKPRSIQILEEIMKQKGMKMKIANKEKENIQKGENIDISPEDEKIFDSVWDKLSKKWKEDKKKKELQKITKKASHMSFLKTRSFF